MAKLSQLDKVLASLDADIAVLQLAKAKLLQQQTTRKPAVRRPRAVAPAVSKHEQAG